MLLGRFAALSNGSQGSTTTAVSHVWALAIAGINGRGKCRSFVLLSEIYWKCVQFYHGTTNRSELFRVHPLPKHRH